MFRCLNILLLSPFIDFKAVRPNRQRTIRVRNLVKGSLHKGIMLEAYETFLLAYLFWKTPFKPRVHKTSVNPDSVNLDLRQNRTKLVVRMISNVFLYKTFPFIRIF